MNLQSALKEFNFVEMNSLTDLDKQYKYLAKKKHPDTGGSKEDFQNLSEAHIFLKKHIEFYKTTKMTRTFQAQKEYVRRQYNKEEQKEDSFYNAESFKQESNFTIYLIYFLCFLFNFKIRTIDGFMVIKLSKKNKFFILSKKDKEETLYSIRLKDNKRVLFRSNKKSVEIYKNVFVIFI